MKKLSILLFLLLMTAPSLVVAESFCEKVNNGSFNEYSQLAKAMNKMLAAKGAQYRTSAKEMKNLMSSYCKENPHSTADDATNYLSIMAEVVAAGEKM